MAVLTVSNISTGSVGVGHIVGTLPPGTTRTLEVSVFDLEDARPSLSALSAAGLIEWSISLNADATDDNAEFLPVGGYRPPTQHMEVGNIGSVSLAPVPGTPDAQAMSFFGQLHAYDDLEIAVIHMHWIIVPAVGNPVTLEVYRADGAVPGPPTFTLLATLTQNVVGGGAEFQTVGAVPSETFVPRSSYFMVQATSGNTNFNGLTVDFHYSRINRA